jgi:phosphoglycolate phosphatase
MPLPRAIVFDLDGTLIDSRHDYAEMKRRAIEVLSDAGVPARDPDEAGPIWEIRLRGMEHLLMNGATEERWREVDALVTDALNEVELSALEDAMPMPGAAETLRDILCRGVRIGVATRSHREYALEALSRSDLSRYVEVILARDDVERPKPDPRHLLQAVTALDAGPGEAVFVGDTTTDQSTARKAGVPFIGIPRNETWARRMEEDGYGVLLNSLREIPAHLVKCQA